MSALARWLRKQFPRRPAPVRVAPVGPGHTTDRDDPRLGHGVDAEPVPQHEVYLVLSEEERARGFVEPVRRTYVHVGPRGPRHPLVSLTPEQAERYAGAGYVMYEPYPESERPALGRFWTQDRLNAVDGGCGATTTMSQALAETYARDPSFYGATYCVGCGRHLALDEFVWDGTAQRVGTRSQ